MGRICAGAGDAPLNSTSRCRGASAPRSGFPFAAAPQARGRGAPTRRTRLKRRARTARQPRSRGAARTLRSVRAPLGAPHGGFWRGPALHRRRCRRIRRAHCARPGVAPGERGPEPPEPAVSAAAPDATPALSSGSSPETPLIERDGRGYSMSPLRSQYLSSIYSQKNRRFGVPTRRACRPPAYLRCRASRCPARRHQRCARRRFAPCSQTSRWISRYTLPLSRRYQLAETAPLGKTALAGRLGETCE